MLHLEALLQRKPDVFPLDEPLSNLDAALRAGVRLEIAKPHQAVGATMIYITHDQAEAMTLANRIVVMNNGRIEQVGTPRQLYEQPANTFVATFIGSPKIALLDVERDSTTLGLSGAGRRRTRHHPRPSGRRPVAAARYGGEWLGGVGDLHRVSGRQRLCVCVACGAKSDRPMWVALGRSCG